MRKTASATQASKECAEGAGEQVNLSNEQMKDMTAAMGEITESSEKISRIIATIEDIAFQTNSAESEQSAAASEELAS